MIIDLILMALTSIPLALLEILPDVTIEIPQGVFDWLITTCNAVGYFLPLKYLMPIFAIVMSINLFKISWAIALRVKSFIPTMCA